MNTNDKVPVRIPNHGGSVTQDGVIESIKDGYAIVVVDDERLPARIVADSLGAIEYPNEICCWERVVPPPVERGESVPEQSLAERIEELQRQLNDLAAQV